MWSGCKRAMQSRFRHIFGFNQYFLLWKKKLYKPDQKFVDISRSLWNTDSCPVYVQLWHQFFPVSTLNPISLISGNRVFLPPTLRSSRLAWQRTPCGTAPPPTQTLLRQAGHRIFFPSSASEKCHTSTKCCWCGSTEAQTAEQGEQGSDLSEGECRGGRSLGRLTLCIGMNVTPWLRTGSCPHHSQLPVSLSPWGRCWMSRRSVSEHIPIVQLHVLHLLSVAFEITQSEFSKVWIRVLSPLSPYTLFLQFLHFFRHCEYPCSL